METVFKWLNKSWVLGLLLVFGVSVDLVLLGRAHDLSKSDWAAWVGSIGTVLTLMGTIWLATTAERTRRREQHDLAIIAAADLTLRLQNLQNALRAAESMLPCHLGAPDDPREAFAQAVKVIEDVGMWTREDLLPLVSIPGHTAARLAWATTKIRSCLVSLKRSSEKTLEELEPVVGVIHMRLSPQLLGCIPELDAVQNELLEFLDKQGFDGP